MATNQNPRHCYVCNTPPEGHNQRAAHVFQSTEDVQRRINRPAPRQSMPLLSAQYVMWVSSLAPQRERLIWCDECHYWHATVNECPYIERLGMKAGA